MCLFSCFAVMGHASIPEGLKALCPEPYMILIFLVDLHADVQTASVPKSDNLRLYFERQTSRS